MDKVEQFSSRWALLLATIGMAIGAGNIWRFPRLAGQYGGAFLVLGDFPDPVVDPPADGGIFPG